MATFTPSTGAGVGAVASTTGSDSEGTISLTTGAAPVLGDIIGDLIYDEPYADPPISVTLTPANVNAAAFNANVWVPITTLAIGKFSLKNTVVALLPATTYIWYFKLNN